MTLDCQPRGQEFIPEVTSSYQRSQFIPEITVHTRECEFIPEVMSSYQRSCIHTRSGVQTIGRGFIPEVTSSHQKSRVHTRDHERSYLVQDKMMWSLTIPALLYNWRKIWKMKTTHVGTDAKVDTLSELAEGNIPIFSYTKRRSVSLADTANCGLHLLRWQREHDKHI